MKVKDFPSRELQRLARRERNRGDWMDLFGEPPPEGLCQPYRLCPEGEARSKRLQQKYVRRDVNIARSWNRVQRFLPELIAAPPCDVFEMSSAHGGMLEVLRHFGHRVSGNDFVNMVNGSGGKPRAQLRAVNDPAFHREHDDFGLPIPPPVADAPDWPYRYIVESSGLDMHIFDGGIVPYPLPDKSQDVVLCLQAIEHYCHPADWMKVVEEFCRIARRSVVILLNRLIDMFESDAAYAEAFDRFRRELRDFDRCGFRCTATFVHYGSALGFKLTSG